ncbi:hypothetical protein FAES_2364 [Fibrella aestuarina BUZ 2]|uniref:Uncharacterized protein n=1 Tax=Fibrella aestuarina BUZ 2 TaxID=1166018 RepID=I0K8C0_9BACT|nr:hypothetical protein FAES_2364 [Fibrella aestuarina BUZ 2]
MTKIVAVLLPQVYQQAALFYCFIKNGRGVKM